MCIMIPDKDSEEGKWERQSTEELLCIRTLHGRRNNVGNHRGIGSELEATKK